MQGKEGERELGGGGAKSTQLTSSLLTRVHAICTVLGKGTSLTGKRTRHGETCTRSSLY